MNNEDFLELRHNLERHEDALTEDAKEIKRLKVDVLELANLIRLLAAFVPNAGFWNGGGKGGIRNRNAATGGTSETSNREMKALWMRGSEIL